MQETIEVVYEKGVFKPLEKVELVEGVRTRIKIEGEKRRKIDFEPVKLREKVSIEKIKDLRDEQWLSF